MVNTLTTWTGSVSRTSDFIEEQWGEMKVKVCKERCDHSLFVTGSNRKLKAWGDHRCCHQRNFIYALITGGKDVFFSAILWDICTVLRMWSSINIYLHLSSSNTVGCLYPRSEQSIMDHLGSSWFISQHLTSVGCHFCLFGLKVAGGLWRFVHRWCPLLCMQKTRKAFSSMWDGCQCLKQPDG